MLRSTPLSWLATITALVLLAACEKKPSPPPEAPAAASPRIASLVPAATDLLVGMGAADHLVAISNYDFERESVRGLPRVGDYETTDWERLALLRPDVMLVQFAPDRLPAGFRDRAENLGIRLVNIRNNTLEDLFETMQTLGEAAGEPDKAASLARDLRRRLDAVRQRTRDSDAPRVLIVIDDTGQHIVGPGNYLDDLLTLAGGRNVAAAISEPYPSITPEQLLQLAPEVIIQLMPEAGEKRLQQAEQAWAKLADIPAIRNGRRCILTEWYVMQPGSHVADVAEQIERCLWGTGGLPPSRP